MLPLGRGGCTAQSSSKTELWAVAPLGWGGCTSQPRSPGGCTSWLGRLNLPTPQPRRLHLLAGAVAPPNPTAQAVAPPGWGGCTSWCNQGPNGSFHSTQFQSFRGPIAPRLSQWDHLPFSNLIIVLTTIKSKTTSAALLRCVNRSFRRVSGELPSIIR